jgi:hypothetical protein
MARPERPHSTTSPARGRRGCEAHGTQRANVDRQLEAGRLLDGDLIGRSALQDPGDHAGKLSKDVVDAGTIGKGSAFFRRLGPLRDGGRALRGRLGEQRRPDRVIEERTGQQVQRLGALGPGGVEGGLDVIALGDMPSSTPRWRAAASRTASCC